MEAGTRIRGNVIYQAAEDGIEDTIKATIGSSRTRLQSDCILPEQSDEEPILLNDVRLALRRRYKAKIIGY